MVKIKEIIQVIEDFAPPSLQESYDNSGQLTGNKDTPCTGVLLTLDCTEEVVQEAIDKKCNLVLAHHPIIFSGIKSLTGKNYIERTIIKAIKNDIVIYACHTNLDNVKNGVNYHIAKLLGLKNVKTLSPKKNQLIKLETYVPIKHTNTVLEALKNAGAGSIGNYTGCSFSFNGTGKFTGNAMSNPTIGSPEIEETVEESKIEVIFERHKSNNIINALKRSHPYEEVAFHLHETQNEHPDIGSGILAELDHDTPVFDFLDHVKSKLGAQVVKHTNIPKEKIKRIAICGGSGSFLLNKAKAAKADLFLTSDFKYHEFFDAENQLVIADIGHYETESNTKALFYGILNEKFVNIALVFSEKNTNPVKYY